MNDYPSSQEENDESYFSSDSFRQNLPDPQSSHVDALHADALGRDITSRDTARSDQVNTDYAEAISPEASSMNFDSANPSTSGYAQQSDFENEARYNETVAPGTLEGGSSESDQLYGSHQSIDSTYFNITNSNDGPVAGLSVLMDTRGQAIRSELYLYEESNEADKQEAIRQANLLLKRQFSSGQSEFDNPMLELRIFETQQKYATVYVDLPERTAAASGDALRQSSSRGASSIGGGSFGGGSLGGGSLGRGAVGGATLRNGSFFGGFLNGGLSRLWPLALGALILLMGIWFLWFILSRFLGGGGFGLTGNETVAPVAIESAADQDQLSVEFDPDKPILNLGTNQGEAAQTEVVQGVAAQGDAVVQGEVVQGEPSGDTQAGAAAALPAQLEWINPSEENRNGLPDSIKANPNIGGSSRVRVLPGIQIMLRSHPGPAAGTELGVMQDGEEGIVVGGPYYTEGESDTIVWWYVRLDSEDEAWVAANTSTLTLLEPVPVQ